MKCSLYYYLWCWGEGRGREEEGGEMEDGRRGGRRGGKGRGRRGEEKWKMEGEVTSKATPYTQAV